MFAYSRLAAAALLGSCLWFSGSASGGIAPENQEAAGENSSFGKVVDRTAPIVEAFPTASTAHDGFFHCSGEMYDLSTPAYLIQGEGGANAEHEVAAGEIAPNGEHRRALLTPVPVAVPPATWAVLSTLPLVLLALRKRPRLARIAMRRRSEF